MINYKDEATIAFKPEDFDRVLSELREYLSKKECGSLSEYILDFCEYRSYRIEDVAEVINSDKELKNLLKQDCIHHKIFRTDDNRMEDW